MKIQKGTKVTYLGKSGSWVKIKYNSKTGYVHKDYIGHNDINGSSFFILPKNKYGYFKLVKFKKRSINKIFSYKEVIKRNESYFSI